MDRAQAGILMLGAGVALIEMWRRGYLTSFVGSLTDPVKRPFALPTAPARDTFLGPEAV